MADESEEQVTVVVGHLVSPTQPSGVAPSGHLVLPVAPSSASSSSASAAASGSAASASASSTSAAEVVSAAARQLQQQGGDQGQLLLQGRRQLPPPPPSQPPQRRERHAQPGGGRKRGATNYKDSEIELLLLAFEEVLPRGTHTSSEWIETAELYERLRQGLAERGVHGVQSKRSVESLWRKFNKLVPTSSKLASVRSRRDGTAASSSSSSSSADAAAAASSSSPPASSSSAAAASAGRRAAAEGERTRLSKAVERATALRRKSLGKPPEAEEVPGSVIAVQPSSGAEREEHLIARALAAIGSGHAGEKRAVLEIDLQQLAKRPRVGDGDGGEGEAAAGDGAPLTVEQLSRTQARLEATIERQAATIDSLTATTNKIYAMLMGRDKQLHPPPPPPPPPRQQEQEHHHHE